MQKDQQKLIELIKGKKVAFIGAGVSHKTLIKEFVELARACAKPGDIIILSPASASFDLYPNFEVRGCEFKKIVNELK